MSRRRNSNRPNAKGRNPTSRFVRLDHRLLNSNAYRALSTNARALLVDLIMLDNGENNGSLYLSVRDSAGRLGLADYSAAGKALDELEALGFITCTADAHFHVKAAEKSRARCWRLTFEAGPGRKGPSHDYMEREPAPGTKSRKRMERGLRVLKTYRKARDSGKLPVLESQTIDPFYPILPAEPVQESRTLNALNSGNLPNTSVRDSSTHTAAPWVKGFAGWWQPDWTEPMKALAYVTAISEHAKRPAQRQAA